MTTGDAEQSRQMPVDAGVSAKSAPRLKCKRLFLVRVVRKW